jgi:hypothetical protein
VLWILGSDDIRREISALFDIPHHEAITCESVAS